MNRVLFGLFLLLTVGFVMASHNRALFAQTTTATILGTVADETGAVLPGASITVTHLDTGEVRRVATDQTGRYRVPQLALGQYEVKAELSGFRTTVRSGITLTIRREAVVDISLQVGAVVESVEVTGEAPLVDTQNAVLSGLVDDRSIAELPLNGRSFDNLITLNAGSFLHQNRERLI
ncbi:MAG: carboxypeptidase regulatory-like domain-containing protein, partial [Acidobacteria bacterium]|nr:carboxypeptidase regulatory-like domain-containing protein [Acidobacteriota bacterium]